MLNRVFEAPNDNDEVYTFKEKDGYGVIPTLMVNSKTPSKKYNTNNNTFGSYCINYNCYSNSNKCK